MEREIVEVREVMNTSIHMVSGLATVEQAIDIMNEKKIGSLVIERRDEKDEYGIVSVYEIAKDIMAVGKSAARTSVYEIMKKPVVTLAPDMNVKYAVRLLTRLGESRALVTGAQGVEGLVTVRNLVLGSATVLSQMED